MNNLDIYFTGPLHFIFKSELESEDDRQSKANYIRDRHSVLCVDIAVGNALYAVSFGPTGENYETHSYIDLVEILEEKLISGENVALVLTWNQLGLLDFLARFAVLNDLVQRARAAREEWREGIKMIVLVGMAAADFFA